MAGALLIAHPRPLEILLVNNILMQDEMFSNRDLISKSYTTIISKLKWS